MKHRCKHRWVALLGTVALMAAPIVAPIAQAETSSLSSTYPALQGIQLTPEQQTQLEALHQQTLAKVQTLLSPEQAAQVQTAIAQGQPLKHIVPSLNLSFAQRRNLMREAQSVRSQINQILTPEQQQQLEQNARSLSQKR